MPMAPVSQAGRPRFAGWASPFRRLGVTALDGFDAMTPAPDEPAVRPVIRTGEPDPADAGGGPGERPGGSFRRRLPG
jgi:hypothetical protein